MARSLAAITALLLAACAAPTSAKEKPPQPPNIVLILIDDLGWRDFGAYGSESYRTPFVDRFCSESLRFTDAYAAAPVCSPTRAAIMTGKHPARTGITDWIPGAHYERAPLATPRTRNELVLEETTLAEALHERGYQTWLVGKWHLGNGEFGPTHQGFDVARGVNDGGHPASHLWPYGKEGETYHVRELEPGREGDYLTDALTDEALALLEQRQARPFFLFLSHYAVHRPLEVPAADIESAQEHLGDRQHDARLAAMVERLDRGLGRLFEALQQLELERDTLVVLTSDNGGDLEGANHPLRAGKGHPYEGGLRVPLVIRWPGHTRAGSVSREPVWSADLFSTLLRAAASGSALANLDGRDLAPLFAADGATLGARDLVWHYPHYTQYDPGERKPFGAMRAGRWKLIEWFESDRLELYDLERDLGETRDLVLEEPALAAELRARLQAWRGAVGAVMPRPNPQHDPEHPFGAPASPDDAARVERR